MSVLDTKLGDILSPLPCKPPTPNSKRLQKLLCKYLIIYTFHASYSFINHNLFPNHSTYKAPKKATRAAANKPIAGTAFNDEAAPVNV